MPGVAGKLNGPKGGESIVLTGTLSRAALERVGGRTIKKLTRASVFARLCLADEKVLWCVYPSFPNNKAKWSGLLLFNVTLP